MASFSVESVLYLYNKCYKVWNSILDNKLYKYVSYKVRLFWNILFVKKILNNENKNILKVAYTKIVIGKDIFELNYQFILFKNPIINI